MHSDLGRWLPLTPDSVAGVPDGPGVFEVANLVRNVLYIGRAEGNMRTRLAGLFQPGNPLPPAPGGYYMRYEATPDEASVYADRMSDYRQGHGGLLPPGNREHRDHRLAPIRVASCYAA